MATQCEYKDNGKSCQAYAMIDSMYCFWHDPKTAKKRAEARKKGGINRRVIKRNNLVVRPIKAVKDINTILEEAINDARTLESSQSQLRTIGYLCQIALKGQELGNLEDRINSIEKILKDKKSIDEY